MANGVINVLFNLVVTAQGNPTPLRRLGSAYCSVTCTATKAVLQSVLSALPSTATPTQVITALKPYFPMVNVPSINPGNSNSPITPGGDDYPAIIGFMNSRVINATISAEENVSLYDDAGNGWHINLQNAHAVDFMLNGESLGIGAGKWSSFGIRTELNNYTGDQKLWSFCSLPIRTVDNKIGVFALGYRRASSYLNFASDADSELICAFLDGVAPPSSDTPYGGEPSGPGGGLGLQEMHYDSISFPELPTTSAVNTGFASVWVPELSEVQALATYMWNCDPTTLDWWRKLKADPLDLILGFYIFPVELTPDGSESVTIGLINTGVEMHYRNSQYVDVDCGTIQLDEYWKAYLDYSPYTRLSIYLPYIGVRPLNIDDVMTRAITLKYRIDLVSGTCVAMIRVDSGTDEQDREAVLYQFTGICSTQIPITSTQMGDIFRSAVSLGVATVAAVASEGASVAIAGAASAAANLASTKPDIAHSGAIGSAAGLMGVQRPYLIIERPRQAVPEEQQHYTGFPSFITEELSELEGYTEVEAVHLHGLGCTENEAQEIERLLLEGVIF